MPYKNVFSISVDIITSTIFFLMVNIHQFKNSQVWLGTSYLTVLILHKSDKFQNSLGWKAEPVPLPKNTSSTIYSDRTEKAEPVPLSENTSSAIYSDSMKKSEPVPFPENISSAIYSDSTEKAEPVPLLENTLSAIYSDRTEKAESVPIIANKSTIINRIIFQ